MLEEIISVDLDAIMAKALAPARFIG